MYIPALRAAVIEIPKNASTTINQAFKKHYGTNLFPGHQPISEFDRVGKMKNWRIEEYHAVIRDPWDRFVSGFNNVFLDLEDGMRRYLNDADRGGGDIFRPQSFFIDDRVRLWRFNQLDRLFDHFGVPFEGHFNKGKGRWSREDFEPWKDEIEIVLSADSHLCPE